jgi:glutamate---cysteine ligase / carboxylate-amine ligase
VDHAFGSTGGFTLGIEEELLLVDAETLELAPVSEQVLPAMTLSDGAQAAHEAFAAQVELRSPIARDVGEATAALASARAAARAAGATLMGAGVHPRGELGDAELVHAERYRAVDAAMRGLIRRTPESALHVHVGMPDPETAIRAFNGLRAHLPLLQALAANSPWWFGIDSGMASARASLVRSYPGRGVPRALSGWDEYLETVETTTRAGELADYTFLWWDVRPHPRLGTVEVREMDAQAPLEDVAAIAALVHGLARAEAVRPPGAPAAPAEAIAWSSFRAARDGLDAELVVDGAATPVREVARAAVEEARPHARELGGEDALEGIERIVREGGGAARQRAAHAEGGLDAVCAALVEATRR